MLNGKQIREVTAQGVRYVDENNVEQFIDFAQCFENYVNERLNPEMWGNYKQLNNQTDTDWDNYVERVKAFKRIGTRNIAPFSENPFIEFYTKPSLKFEFETLDEWYQIVNLITNTEYITFDLS